MATTAALPPPPPPKPTNEYDIPLIGETLMLLIGRGQHLFIQAKNLLVDMFHNGAQICIAKTAAPFLDYIDQARTLQGFHSWVKMETLFCLLTPEQLKTTERILGLIKDIIDASFVFQKWLDEDLGFPEKERSDFMHGLRSKFIELGVGRAVKLKWEDDAAKNARRIFAKERAKLKGGR